MSLVPLGIYISVPFCRTKCTFCNFASGVFSRELFDRYVTAIVADIHRAEVLAEEMGGRFERAVDSVYLGGGTPSLLSPYHLSVLFEALHERFDVLPGAEITVECAPGTLNPDVLGALAKCRVNRVSLGVQSFVDQECRAVGRMHTCKVALSDIEALRGAGITDIGIDLIAGLPHQTRDSWHYSLDQVIATEVPHVSVYMLEVDEDSRLGSELIGGGQRYHAHFVPDDDLTADLYLEACERLNSSGVRQYEISNFARGAVKSGIPMHASRHNLKYWTRQPYLGFGVDAHSMLSAPSDGERHAAVRFATTESLESLLAGVPRTRVRVNKDAAVEESWFLGLRLNRGVDLTELQKEFGIDAVERYRETIDELVEAGLLNLEDGFARLTDRGRLLSNEVFSRFISSAPTEESAAVVQPKLVIL